MTAQSPKNLSFDRTMSDAEALMWNVEKDPWLNPNGGVVTVVDQPIDFDSFRIRMKHAVAEVPRLRERVVAGFGRVSPPSWVTDDEFDFDYHVRHIMLPSPGSLRQLYDLSTRLYEDPYDRTRPLWTFVVIDGLEGGKGALFWKSHHSITDGYGMVRLAERYMETERDAEVPPDIDLGEVVADAITSADSSHDRRGTIQSAARSAGHVRRRQAGRLQRAAGEMAIWAAEPAASHRSHRGLRRRGSFGVPPVAGRVRSHRRFVALGKSIAASPSRVAECPAGSREVSR